MFGKPSPFVLPPMPDDILTILPRSGIYPKVATRSPAGAPSTKLTAAAPHLASIIALPGAPPADLVARGRLSAKFFFNGAHAPLMLWRNYADHIYIGTFNAGTHLPPAGSLDATQTNPEGHDKELFMRLVRKMMQWTPEDRCTAADLSRDPWINSH